MKKICVFLFLFSNLNSLAQEQAISSCLNRFYFNQAQTLAGLSPDEMMAEIAKKDSLFKECLRKTKMPTYTLKDINENVLGGEDLYNKVLIFNFWFVGCTPCHQEMPSLIKLANEYKDNKNVVFISVARNTKEQLELNYAMLPYNWIILSKENQYRSLFDTFYPTTIITNASGYIEDIWIGVSVDEDATTFIYDQLKSYLARLEP
jgi:thiol-disulfide isomerase/thioredoxin